MYILAKLVFKNYVPLKLEQGMLFISKQTDTVYGKVYEYLQLHTLIHIPRDKESYINTNGFPVEPYIIAQNQNSDDKETVLVQPEHIGWFMSDDEGGAHTIDIKDFNLILEEYDGEMCIEVEDTESDDTEDMVAILIDGKVIIRTADDMPEDDEEEDEWDDDEDEYYDIGGSE